MEENDNLWVIKDNNNLFAHGSSIKLVGRNTMAYIAFKTFSPECRGYVTRQKAEEALVDLNKKKNIMGITKTFHLEDQSWNKLIDDYERFLGENMVYLEKKIEYIPELIEAI